MCIRDRCRDAYLDIKIIQPEGKKVMKSEDYLRGVDVKNLKLLTNLQA
jgi:methionyl-tRNA formyltransferase